MTLGRWVCVLRDGRLQQADTPQQLFEAPVNLFVAGFIGSPAMNFMTTDLVRDDGPAVAFAASRCGPPASRRRCRSATDALVLPAPMPVRIRSFRLWSYASATRVRTRSRLPSGVLINSTHSAAKPSSTKYAFWALVS